MALSIEEVQKLYRKGEYEQVVGATVEWHIEHPQDPMGEYELLAAWANHQLGKYEFSTETMWLLYNQYPSDSEIGDSTRRGLAHGLLQLGKVEEAQRVLAELQPSLDRDNVRANAILQDARADRSLPMPEVQHMLAEAMWTIPHQTVCGHIVNNLSFALYEARAQQEVRPYLSMLAGLVEIAVGIYEETRAQKNHLAGCLFRASNIFLDIANWPKGALVVIDESIAFWEQLVSSEGGERYQQNLEGARTQHEKILIGIGS